MYSTDCSIEEVIRELNELRLQGKVDVAKAYMIKRWLMMKRLERYSTTKKQEIGLILKIMNFLKILDKMDKNSLGWE